MRPAVLFGPALLLCTASSAGAREYYVGGPVHEHDMEIVANYLVGVQMDHAGTASGPDVIHLEADVHATADNVHGFPDGAWVPYLTVHYRLEKQGADWRLEGTLRPMQAKDGPHYADNVRMDGPGTYVLTYRFLPPDENGYMRHVDKETGIPEWWKPFSTRFTFQYPQR